MHTDMSMHTVHTLYGREGRNSVWPSQRGSRKGRAI
jgi:hypothetical protein